jgi:hypothetical protein
MSKLSPRLPRPLHAYLHPDLLYAIPHRRSSTKYLLNVSFALQVRASWLPNLAALKRSFMLQVRSLLALCCMARSADHAVTC